MNLCQRAFEQLYPTKSSDQYEFALSYSGRFKGYNANVKYLAPHYHFQLSSQWKHVDEDIQIGVIQHLMRKVFRFKASSHNNIDYYDSFMKNVHKTVIKKNVDQDLKDCFERVNEQYFLGALELTNLKWGTDSTSLLGHYDYGTDTITISTIFKEAPERLLDFVMYHEMLHKKHKFNTTKNGRNVHHSTAFRKEEALFESFSTIDDELKRFARKQRRKINWGF